nr:MAG TPA: hypothetical protein [Caudoviricetes sp.]
MPRDAAAITDSPLMPQYEQAFICIIRLSAS